MKKRIHHIFLVFLFGILSGKPDAFALSDGFPLTQGERREFLDREGLSRLINPATTRVQTQPGSIVSDIEGAIRMANSGENGNSFRNPVSEREIFRLQRRAARRGHLISVNQMRAMTDYAHALMAESPKMSLADKVRRLPETQRKAFHGNVAEIAEARARGLVLTKSRQSPMWDLTENKPRPRNYQMKVYAQSNRALDSMFRDLNTRTGFTRHGITTKDTLERGVKTKMLVTNGKTYSFVGHRDIKLHPSKVFSRPAESAVYAKTGRDGLIKANHFKASSQNHSSLKWIGRVGIAVAIAAEAYLIYGYYTGQISPTQFWTAQAGVGGGIIGGTIGVVIGTAVAGPLGGLVGASVGGIIGGYLGSTSASFYFSKLNDHEKAEVSARIYHFYGIAP